MTVLQFGEKRSVIELEGKIYIVENYLLWEL